MSHELSTISVIGISNITLKRHMNTETQGGRTVNSVTIGWVVVTPSLLRHIITNGVGITSDAQETRTVCPNYV